MMEKKIVALTGVKGSGKSSVARALYNKLDNCMIIPMAGLAKQCVELITGVGMNELQPDGSYDYSQKQKQMLLPSGMELGLFLREFAEAVRGIDKLIWIDSTFNIIDSSNNEWFIIPDVRMIEEYNAINKLNEMDGYQSFIFRINAGAGIKPNLLDGRDLSHRTENQLADEVYDGTYVNVKGQASINSIADQIARKVRSF